MISKAKLEEVQKDLMNQAFQIQGALQLIHTLIQQVEAAEKDMEKAFEQQIREAPLMETDNG